MRPEPRQQIYKFNLIKNIYDFITFGFFNNNNKKKLEEYFQNFFKYKNVLCINRGRIGTYLAVKAAITKNKNKIILSPFTIFDVINMAICAGAQPVFCDVEKKSITIDLENIKKVYDENVGAIMITHTHVINKDIQEIVKFAKEKNIILIEDCAISFGTKLNNKYIGTIGDIGFFSFGIFKFVSSLNGGLIITKDSFIFKKIFNEHKSFLKQDYNMLIKNFLKSTFVSFFTNRYIFKFFSSFIIKFGFLNNIKSINQFSKNDPNPHFLENLPESYKKNISNTQAGLILDQAKMHIIDFKIRIKNAKIYYNNLKDIKDLIIPKFNDNFENGWINFPIQYNKRDKLLKFLFLNNRDLAIYFYRNCNDLDIFNKYNNPKLVNIKNIVKDIIILPTYPKYSEKQVYRNISLIKKYFNK